MFGCPPRFVSIFLCALLSSWALAIAAPVFADEPGDETPAAPSGLARESAPDVAADVSAIEEFERRMDRQLADDVSRRLDAIVANRAARQMRRLAQHYFDGAPVRGRVPPGASSVALTSPANSR